jgi:hypothetical protein
MEFKTLLNPIEAVRSAAPETFSISGLEVDEARTVAERVSARVRGVEVLAVRARGWMGLGDTCEVTIRGTSGARRSFRRHMRRLARSLQASELTS